MRLSAGPAPARHAPTVVAAALVLGLGSLLGIPGSALAALVLGVAIGVLIGGLFRRGTGARAGSSQELAGAFESVGHAFATLDPDWRFTHLNRRAETVLGRRDLLVGRTLWDVFPETRGTPLHDALTTAVATAKPARVEFFDASRDAWFEVDVHATAGGMAVSFQDLTERKRTEQRLATQYAVARILAEGTDVDDVSVRVLEAMGTAVGWGVGALWRVDRSQRLLDCVAVWEAPGTSAPEFIAATRSYRFPPGIGLAGRVWESAGPHWIPDVVEDANFPRARAAAHDGLHGAFGFPILLRGEVQGVVEFFSHEIRRPDAALLAETAAIGSQIGQFIERARTEDALRQSEERLRLAGEATGMGTFDWDVGSGTIVWSSTMEGIHGLVPGTFGGTLEAFLTCVHPDEHDTLREQIARDLAHGPGNVVEYRTRWPDGTVRIIQAKAAVYRDEVGRPLRVTGIGMDVTERTRLEEARARLLAIEQAARATAEAAERRAGFLAEASAVLSSSLDYETTLASIARLAVPRIADWCVVDAVDPEGAIRRLAVAHADPVQMNRAWEIERRFPMDPRAPTGPPAVIRSGRPFLLTEIDETMLAASARDPLELDFLRGLGLSSAMCVPLHARGETLGAITFASTSPTRRYEGSDLTVAEDLARRAGFAVDNARLYRSAQEANRVKDEFLATLSHELRTPLSAILGWTRILRTQQVDEAASARGLETIERNTRLQAQLIEDLLDVSRIITGKLRLELQPVDLPAAVEAAIDTVRPAADAKELRLETTIDQTVGFVSGDPDRLQQVVWNLLSNAIKFTPRGGRLAVRVERSRSDAVITVTDTGKGIPASFLPHIFERFRQADSSSTRTHGGLGLGLAIVRHLVELHRGHIRAESDGEGKGSSFVVHLPLATLQVDVLEVATVRPLPAFTAPALTGMDILVVDDDPDAREALVLVLETEGATVTAVASAEEAFAALEAHTPDVLVSDIAMPGTDGYELMAKLREREAAASAGHVPALALSAYAREEDRRRALAAGFEMHVAKPVDPARLAEVLSELTGREGRRGEPGSPRRGGEGEST